MTTWQVLSLAGPRDVVRAGRRQVVRVRFDAPGHHDAPHTDVADVLAHNGLIASPVALDLLRLATTVFVADTRVPRSSAFDHWTRDLVLRTYVHDLSVWSGTEALLVDLLAFLTGDHWAVELRQAPDRYRPVPGNPGRNPRKLEADTVCFLSGGLDSFAGAVDLLEAGGRLAFVGHQTAGGGATSRSQRAVSTLLRGAYGPDHAPHLRMWVAPPTSRTLASETTTRSRSLLFFGLAIAVASGLRARRLVVPENGFISLNVPLTPSRLGSLSTRTTHPHFVSLLRSLLARVGVTLEIDLPYRFLTKGELLRACRNQGVLRSGLADTVSCSHPESNRYRAGSPNLQCGRCVPCLVRRAAIATTGADPTGYAVVDLSQPLAPKSGTDLRAVRFGLLRYAAKRPTLADVLVPGPIEAPLDELAEYVGVFGRGLDELRGLLNST